MINIDRYLKIMRNLISNDLFQYHNPWRVLQYLKILFSSISFPIYVHTCGTVRVSEVVVPAGKWASTEECLKTSLSHSVRDKNGPAYYYDFNAADRRCKSRSCNALLPIGTADRHGDWFFGIHADRRGARYHRRHGETAVVLARETQWERKSNDIRTYTWKIHVLIHIYGVAAFGHFSFRRVAIGGHNRFKATDALPVAVGRIVLSCPSTAKLAERNVIFQAAGFLLRITGVVAASRPFCSHRG